MIEKTDETFWKIYWKGKTINTISAVSTCLTNALDKHISEKKNIVTSLEVGGFPGAYSAHIKKKHQVKTTILDRHVDPDITNKVFGNFNIPSPDILKADLFAPPKGEKFDFVFSLGVIEHFENIDDVIYQHLKFINKNGSALMTMPNFLGLNGLVQWIFDRQNLSAHNLDSMNIRRLRKKLTTLTGFNANIFYYGKFGIWLESLHEKSKLTKIAIVSLQKLCAVIHRIIPAPNKFLSPYIIIQINKDA